VTLSPQKIYHVYYICIYYVYAIICKLRIEFWLLEDISHRDHTSFAQSFIDMASLDATNLFEEKSQNYLVLG